MHGLYLKASECLHIMFDLRCPGAEERLERERAAWHGYAHVETLTADSAVLIVQPGAATRLAA